MSFKSIVTTALVAATVAAPAAEARIDPPPHQDLRGPDARPAPRLRQDLRSPDARDAARPPIASATWVLPAKPPARATEPSDGDFPWLETALIATLVTGSAGLASWRLRTAASA